MRRPGRGSHIGTGTDAAALLIGVPRPLASDWLASAIDHADIDDLLPLAVAAAGTGGPALDRILTRFDVERMAPSLASAIADALRTAPELVAASARAIAIGLDPAAARGVVALLGGRSEAATDDVLALLATETGPTGDLAAEAILARRMRPVDRPFDEPRRDRLAAAWALHRRPGVLAALAIDAGRRPVTEADVRTADGVGAGEGLDGDDGDGTIRDRDRRAMDLALGSVFQRLPAAVVDETLLPFVIRWLPHPRLGRSAAGALHTPTEAEGWRRALSAGHLLRLPRWRAALGTARRPARCVPAARPIDALDVRSNRAAVTLAAALPLGRSARAEALSRFSSNPDPAVRWRAAVGLSDLPARSTATRLGAIAGAGDAPGRGAARAAARRLRATAVGAVLDERLAAASDTGVARAAARRLGRATIEREGQKIRASRCPAAHRLIALRASARDRGGTSERLASVVGGAARAPRPARVEAIATVRRLGLGRSMQPALERAAGDPDAHVASAAISAMGHARRADVDGVIRAALGHADARVRADAIEALDRRRVVEPVDLESAIGSNAARERAAAAVALDGVSPDRARQLVDAMLEDARPEHRLAGLFAAGRRRDPASAPAIGRIAAFDPIAGLRWTARLVLSALDVEAPVAGATPELAAAASPTSPRSAAVTRRPTAMVEVQPETDTQTPSAIDPAAVEGASQDARLEAMS